MTTTPNGATPLAGGVGANSDLALDPTRAFTKSEVAAMLGVSPRTVDNFRARGQLRAVQLGPGIIRFRATDLREFLDAAPPARTPIRNKRREGGQ